MAHRSGCLVCGADLLYRLLPEPVACALCGRAGEASVRCAAGHYVCDACHALPAAGAIEARCAATQERDPRALALALMADPRVAMHGPEHHFLVPAVLLATLSNARGEPERRSERVAQARRRAEKVLGGFCGTHGACGAGVGVGIAVSVLLRATPLSEESWGLANEATARALLAISRHGGPRCCKRDTLVSIDEAARFAAERLGLALPLEAPAVCTFSDLNRQCRKSACPFHPAVAATG